MAKGSGGVYYPNGMTVWPHEERTASALARTGRSVSFIPRKEGRRVKSADIVMDGVEWEMKAPKAAGLKALDRILRRAVRQSRNIVIDAARIDGSTDAQIERDLRRVAPLEKTSGGSSLSRRTARSLTSKDEPSTI